MEVTKFLSLCNKDFSSPGSNTCSSLSLETPPWASRKSRFLLKSTQGNLHFLMYAFQNTSSHCLFSSFITALTFLNISGFQYQVVKCELVIYCCIPNSYKLEFKVSTILTTIILVPALFHAWIIAITSSWHLAVVWLSPIQSTFFTPMRQI